MYVTEVLLNHATDFVIIWCVCLSGSLGSLNYNSTGYEAKNIELRDFGILVLDTILYSAIPFNGLRLNFAHLTFKRSVTTLST